MKIMLIQTLRYLRKSPFELLETDALLNVLADAQDSDRGRGPGIHAVQIVVVDGGILLETGQGQLKKKVFL